MRGPRRHHPWSYTCPPVARALVSSTAMSCSVAIVGAGAIGAWLGDAFDRAGWPVSMLARGATLHALRSEGLRVSRAGNTRHCRPRAGTAVELGAHDFVFLTVKAQI